MRRVAACLLLVAAVAGCGGSSKQKQPPPYAYLTAVDVEGSSIRFEFESPPEQVRARYVPKAQIAECGSGASIPLRGSAFAVIHFQPAASAEIKGEQVVPTYEGAKRLRGPGPVLDVVKSCDFEADLGWSVGVERRLPLDVSQKGSTVTVTFG